MTKGASRCPRAEHSTSRSAPLTTPDLRRDHTAVARGDLWVGLAALAYGLVSGVILLAQGGHLVLFQGSYLPSVMQRLALALPLAIAGATTLCAGLGLARTRRDSALWLAVVAVAGALMNVVAYLVVYGVGAWRLLIPIASIHGVDLRDGLINPARAFSTARSGWPPLTIWLGKPFTLLSLHSAYVVQFIILLALAVVATWLSVTLAALVGDRLDPASGRPTLPRVLFVAMLVWLLTSYGLMYEVERGNIDLYALVFALLAIGLTLRTRTAWLPALCLAVAVNLKVYPALLAVVLLWRYRFRAVVPLVVCFEGLALSAGFGNLHTAVSSLSAVSGQESHLGWGGNSAASFVYVLRHIYNGVPPGLSTVFLLFSLALWVATLVVLARRGWSKKGAVFAAAACVPVMCTLPSISNDYKLVLFVFPLAVMGMAVSIMKRTQIPATLRSALFLALAMEMVVLARSSQNVQPSVLGSKFVAIMLLQVLMLVVVLLLRDDRPVDEAGRLSSADALS